MYDIFTHYIWLIYMVNVGKYTSPMDPMGSTPNTPISRHIDIAISSIHGLFNEGFIDSPIAHLSVFCRRKFLGEDIGVELPCFIGNNYRPN